MWDWDGMDGVGLLHTHHEFSQLSRPLLRSNACSKLGRPKGGHESDQQSRQKKVFIEVYHRLGQVFVNK